MLCAFDIGKNKPSSNFSTTYIYFNGIKVVWGSEGIKRK